MEVAFPELPRRPSPHFTGVTSDRISPTRDPVDGTITVGELTNVINVGRPVFGQSNSRVMLFKLEPEAHSAKKVPVQLGASSVNRIEIKSGLQPGDKVIISDMSRYDGVAAIVLR